MPSKEETPRQVYRRAEQGPAMELQSIHQYMSHHYKLDDLDYGELAAKMKLIAIDEMRHAEAFAERIKELGGEPTTDLPVRWQRASPWRTSSTFDAEEEDKALDAYNQFLLVCRENGDSI